MSVWDLDLRGFHDISEFGGSQLFLSTGIKTKSKCDDITIS